MAIQPILASDQDLLNHAELATSSLSAIHYHTGDEQTPTESIEIFYTALRRLEELSGALALVGNMTEGEAKEVLHDHESLAFQAALIHVLIKRIPFCAPRQHVSSHFTRLEQLRPSTKLHSERKGSFLE